MVFLVLFVGFTCIISWRMLLPTTRRLQAKLRLRSDVAEGYIAQDDGQVSFTKKYGYVARTSRGMALRNLDGGVAVNLAPGAYHVYFLPRSRRLLSAEPQEQFEPGVVSGTGTPADSLLVALAQANGFSLIELELNRQGRISFLQRFAALGRTLFMLALAVGVAIAAVVLVTRGAPLAGILIVGVALFLLYLVLRTSLDVLAGRTERLDGTVYRSIESNDGPTYYYTVNKHTFTVSREAYNALVSGRRYRVYFLPRSKRLASIEPLPPEQ